MGRGRPRRRRLQAGKAKAQVAAVFLGMSTLLERGEHDQQLDATGKTKLIKAAEEKDVALARSLLTNNASCDLANKDGQTPLYTASKAGCAELCMMLLHARADIAKANSAGFSPLWVASQKGHLEAVNSLLTAKADVNQGAKNRSTPLFIASEVGHARIVKILLRADASVDTPKNDDSTPLIAASYFGRADIVEMLLQAVRSAQSLQAWDPHQRLLCSHSSSVRDPLRGTGRGPRSARLRRHGARQCAQAEEVGRGRAPQGMHLPPSPAISRHLPPIPCLSHFFSIPLPPPGG